MTWRGEPDGITGTSNVTYVCPPDAYQHEPNAPAHRHHDRCQRIEPFVDEAWSHKMHKADNTIVRSLYRSVVA